MKSSRLQLIALSSFVGILSMFSPWLSCSASSDHDEDAGTGSRTGSTQTYKIEGKVTVTDNRLRTDWISETKLLLDGGDHVGFLKSDGTFTINLVPPGSHLVEVASPNYVFEKFRVDITKGGKIRARRANFVQPTAVQVVPYPLRFHAVGQAPFFEIRETWKITDFLFNPMVIMMVLPLLFLVVMPKLLQASDPDTQKEMQNQMNLFSNQQQLPDMSDIMTNWFSSGSKKKTTSDRAVAKKGGKRR